MDTINFDLIIAEYSSLREEILKRIEIRYQLLTITITAFGAILAFGSQLKSAILIFLYPLLALCSMVIWLSNKYDIEQISSYIRKRIEDKGGKEYLNWESQRVLNKRKGIETFLAYGTISFFISTQLLALVIGVVMFSSYTESKNIVALVCAILAVLCFIVTVLLLVLDKIRNNKKREEEERRIAGSIS